MSEHRVEKAIGTVVGAMLRLRKGPNRDAAQVAKDVCEQVDMLRTEFAELERTNAAQAEEIARLKADLGPPGLRAIRKIADADAEALTQIRRRLGEIARWTEAHREGTRATHECCMACSYEALAAEFKRFAEGEGQG